MPQPCPARVGDPVDQIETPALVVDLDVYEHNLDRMAGILAGRDIRFRPHAKTHKSPEVALDQIKRGAVGVCCQKVSEAEIMVQGGVHDVLLSNQIVGRSKARRVAKLAKQARIAVCADNKENIAELDAAAKEADITLSVLVEVEVGGDRCGVPPGKPALELAQIIQSAPNLEFGGLQVYHGNAQHIRKHTERHAAIAEAARKTTKTVNLLSSAGFECRTLAGGGTGSLDIDLELGVLNELQAGSYIFMDADYGRNFDRNEAFIGIFKNSLFVLASVMSTPRNDLAIIDAGLKAVAFDSGNPVISSRTGVIYAGPSDEHGNLDVSDNNPLLLGETVWLIPGHCDPTVNLYDWYVGIRGDRVERVWPVAARGALS
ncbi:MAG: DSD1 family PLP-dependent enzyme [Rhodospirillales bacterium]|jgi:3-hydroxy-D-aspartate aldolase|nr:DSD1 family PLP-dependent enzyme [Rhodospirillales bacterium]